MAESSYQHARRLGLKEVKARAARHEETNLPALELLLPGLNALNEVSLGVQRIDIDQVAGTRSAARRDAFSPSFYPLLDEDSEFAAKWSALAASHLEEGIQEPIQALEYLNRFYVVEGHKRVSVLRFFGATTLRAQVTRLLPKADDSPEYRVYEEFLGFYRVTRVNNIVFDRPGRYGRLLELLCGEDRSPWDEERRRGLYSDVARFRRALQASPLSGKLDRDEALLRYLEVFGGAHLELRTPTELKADLNAIAPELLSQGSEAEPVLMTVPEEEPQRGLLSRIFPPSQRVIKAAFLHDKNPYSSLWTAGHEQGRLDAREALGEKVETCSYFDVLDQDLEALFRKLAEEGTDMVFTTTPRLLPAALTAAGAYPQIKFLNCSLNVSHPIIRTYYARLYEATFLTGVIAGALSGSGNVGYVCSYPVYSMPASINAFALGARMVSPQARVFLQWSSVPGSQSEEDFRRSEVTAVSGPDSAVPAVCREDLGLFLVGSGGKQRLARSRWNWGRVYTRIISSVLDGSWDSGKGVTQSGQSINYWWGLESQAVEAELFDALPTQTATLVRLLRDSLIDGSLHPFEGPIRDQSGALRVADGLCPSPGEILHMDWLVDNVVGTIPRFEELSAEAQELVKLQGVLRDEK